MARFCAQDYKERLAASESWRTCEKVPLPKLYDKSHYIFISYSHKDYKQVYADLADLYENNIPFWYDSGLDAGANWDDVVPQKLNDPFCIGAIFYMSERLFLSRSIQKEIDIVCTPEDESSRKKYFCVLKKSISALCGSKRRFRQTRNQRCKHGIFRRKL